MVVTGLLLKTANTSGAEAADPQEPADSKSANLSSNKEIQSQNPDQKHSVYYRTCPHEASVD